MSDRPPTIYTVRNGVSMVKPAPGELSILNKQDPHYAAIVSCTRNPELYPDLDLDTTLQRGVTYEDIASSLPLPNGQKLPEFTAGGSYDNVISSIKTKTDGAVVKDYRCVSVQPSTHTANDGTQLYDAYSVVMSQSDASKVRARLQKENEWSWAANRAVVVPMVACAGAALPVAVGAASLSTVLVAEAAAVLAIAGGWLSMVGTGLVTASKNS